MVATNSRIDGCDTPDYKTVSLKWPLMALVLAYICTLLGIIEYAYRILPVLDDYKGVVPEPVPGDAATSLLLSAPLAEATKQVVENPRLGLQDTLEVSSTILSDSLSAQAAHARARSAAPPVSVRERGAGSNL